MKSPCNFASFTNWTYDLFGQVSYSDADYTETFNPNDRTHLTGDQLRNRVLTDEFEPGSIMKPFTISLALDLHRVAPTTLVDTGPGHFNLDGATITDDSASNILVCARIGGRGAGVWRASGGGTVDYFAALTRNKRVSG